MDAARFDALTRRFNTTAPRRAFGLFGTTTLGSLFAMSALRDAEGKKRKRKRKKPPAGKQTDAHPDKSDTGRKRRPVYSRQSLVETIRE
jgi:hypothetical protein